MEIYSTQLNSIPKELLTEIFSRVASASFIDLICLKKSCREFHEAASDDYIFERMAISSLPVVPWNDTKDGALSLLDRCLKCGNPESLFRKGMVNYFSTSEHESGLECLKKATHKGHPAATYMYGIILMCYGGKARTEGLKLLCELLKRSKKLSSIVKECRDKVRRTVRQIWVNNHIVGFGPAEEKDCMNKTKNCSCRRKGLLSKSSNNMAHKKSSSRWKFSLDEEFEDDKLSCHACLWDREAIRFCNMLRTGRFKSCYVT